MNLNKSTKASGLCNIVDNVKDSARAWQTMDECIHQMVGRRGSYVYGKSRGNNWWYDQCSSNN